jgi:O-antigen/teichoic acid export membrane protein
MNPSPLQRQRHMVDGTIRVLLAEALLIPTGFIITVFLTRKLGPEDYGLFTLAAVLVAWVETSIQSVFDRTTVKFVGQAEEWRPVATTVVRLHLAASAGATLLLWLLAPSIATLLNEPLLATYLRLFALDIPLYSLARAHRNILVGIGNFRQRALTSAGRWITRLLLIVLLVELGFSVQGAILGSIGASLVELVIGRFYVRPSLSRRSDFPVRKLWGYAVPLFLFALSLRFYSKLDLFMLKALGGTAVLAGIYGAAQNLSRLPKLFVKSLSPLLLSTLSRTLRAGEGRPARELGRNAMRVVIGLLPLAGMTAGAAPEIVELIFGRQYLPAAPLLSLLVFGAVASAMISVTTAILTAAGKPGWTFALTGPLLPLAAAGHLLLIPHLGAIGASLVTTVVASLGALAAVWAVYRIWRILPPASTLLRSILICVLAYALAALWPTAGFLLLLKLPVIILVILFAFVLLGEFSNDEIALARSLLRWQTAPEQNPREV